MFTVQRVHSYPLLTCGPVRALQRCHHQPFPTSQFPPEKLLPWSYAPPRYEATFAVQPQQPWPSGASLAVHQTVQRDLLFCPPLFHSGIPSISFITPCYVTITTAISDKPCQKLSGLYLTCPKRNPSTFELQNVIARSRFRYRSSWTKTFDLETKRSKALSPHLGSLWKREQVWVPILMPVHPNIGSPCP